MKNRLVSTVIVGAAAVAVLLDGSVACAADTVNGNAVDCTICTMMGLACTDPACTSLLMTVPPPQWVNPVGPTGVIDALFWNNMPGPRGVMRDLVRDMNGVMVTTAAEVLWESTNTFQTTGRGEENNNFTDSNRALMTGYLDQNTQTPSPTFVQITNLPDDLAVKYDVIIYTLGGVPNRGGEYAVNGGAPKYVVASGAIRGHAVFNGPDFVEAIGNDPAFGESDWWNYVVFQNLSGTTVTITATNTFGDVPRAPINGFQIVNRQP